MVQSEIEKSTEIENNYRLYDYKALQKSSQKVCVVGRILRRIIIESAKIEISSLA